MQIDTSRKATLAQVARLAFMQTKFGISCRLYNGDEGWTVNTEICGKNGFIGITVVCNDKKLRTAVARELRDLGRIDHNKRLFVEDQHFTVYFD